MDLFKSPPRGRADTDSEDTVTPPGSLVSSQTRQKQQGHVLQATLREAVGPGGTTMLIKVPFSTMDLKTWKKVAKDYHNNPVSVTKHLQFIVKQHNPDWNEIQLLLEAMTETERQLIIKTAGDLAEDYYKMKQEDVGEFFPLQDLKWDPNRDLNRSAELERLRAYQERIVKGVERAIPKTINWSALYAVKQGPSELPSEFLDQLRDTICRNTPLDPGSEVGVQQLVSLFLGQSTGDIRRKLQKLQPTEGGNLEILLDEAW